MTVEEIVLRTPAETEPFVDDIIGIYDRAFREPPYSHSASAAAGFRQTFRDHMELPGYEAIVLRERNRLTGFIYGHVNRPDQWWYRQVAPFLSTRDRRDIFDGAWTIVELAVDPADRGRGFGRRLLRRSCAGKPMRYAVLSTMVAQSPAMGLYESEGFFALVPDFRFAGTPGRWCVLARDIGPQDPLVTGAGDRPDDGTGPWPGAAG